jgi:hypothetical protein
MIDEDQEVMVTHVVLLHIINLAPKRLFVVLDLLFGSLKSKKPLSAITSPFLVQRLLINEEWTPTVKGSGGLGKP